MAKLINLSVGCRKVCTKLVLVVILFWLVWQLTLVLNLGVAGRYAGMSSSVEALIDKTHKVESRQELYRQNYRFIQTALILDPKNSAYRLKAASFLSKEKARNDKVELGNDAFTVKEHLIAGLSDSPTRADLWAFLAQTLFEEGGVTNATTLALNKAVLFGPKEEQTLIVSAVITFYGWADLDKGLRQRGWVMIAKAMEETRLRRRIMALAQKSGWDRQLKQLMKQKRLEKNYQRHG